jgi:hypothetical protein
MNSTIATRNAYLQCLGRAAGAATADQQQQLVR